MNTQTGTTQSRSAPARPAPAAAHGTATQTNGAGAAAVLAAGIGSFLLAVFAIIGDKSTAAKSFFVFSKPTGPLSGVTTSAAVLWTAIWILLHLRWRSRSVQLARINAISIALLILAVLLTFPPIADLF
jgi:integral membrane sensor domain MASE1